jgi:glycosyltransferase involved in cell wall biosynthesis
MSYRYVFTVFTPSYNRAATLPRVYESLRSQTFRDFEWLIVDDGSTDGTRYLVENWQQKAEFPIRYIYQENQGKPAAFNHGVREARGELFLSVDSDDAPVPEGLERLKFHWDAIPQSDRDRFSAVTGLCKLHDGRLAGDEFPGGTLDSDSIEMAFRYRIRGDKWGFQRTDVLKCFPFACGPTAKFVCESTVWFAIARRFKTRFVSEPLLIIYPDAAGTEHLSALNEMTISARAAYHRYVLNELMDWLSRSPGHILKSAINFSRYSFGLRKGPLKQFRELNSFKARAMVAASSPLGLAMALRDAQGQRHAQALAHKRQPGFAGH